MKKAAKVLVHSNYHPNNYGGIEFVVNQILKTLSQLDCTTSCFFGGESNSKEVVDEKHQLISRKIQVKIGGACVLSFGNLNFIREAFNVKLVIFQEPYPTLWPAILFLRYVLRRQLIVLIHANPVSKPWIMRLYNSLRSSVFSGAICVATSPNLLNNINTDRFKKSYVVPLCISHANVIQARTLDLPPKYALYIGRLAQYKGIKYIIEAASMLSDVTFVMAGAGPLSNFIFEEIHSKQLTNIIFINRFVSDDEKFELIENCEFVLFPSISENEAFGLVQLEAMRSRKAIINTYLDSGVNYVAPNSECAVTVEKCNSNRLAEAIHYLWINQDYSLKLGENGFNRFQSLFSEFSFVKSWREIIADNLSIK